MAWESDSYEDDGVVELECGFCGDIFMGFGEFTEVLQEARDEGWVSVKKGHNWFNYCSPGCQAADDF